MQGLANYFLKYQIVNILDFMGYMVNDATTNSAILAQKQP